MPDLSLLETKEEEAQVQEPGQRVEVDGSILRLKAEPQTPHTQEEVVTAGAI